MSPLEFFWSVLEDVPGLSAVNWEWKQRMGADYSFGSQFLHPRDRETLWLPNPDGPGEPYRVVKHTADDLVAISPDGGDIIPITRDDVLVNALRLEQLLPRVAEALGIKPALAPVDGLHQTYQVGFHNPYAGISFPVYASVVPEPEHLSAVTQHLILLVQKSFLLLAPTRRNLLPASEQLLTQNHARFLPLDEIIQVDNQDGLFSETDASELLADFIEPAIHAQKRNCKFFPTPPEARWTDVKITIKDGETASVRVKSASGIYNYTEMGMSDQRDKKPTKQWKLLLTFADSFGDLNWSNRQASHDLQKHREKLAENLVEFFRIEGNPIQFEKESKGWKTRFHISNIV